MAYIKKAFVITLDSRPFPHELISELKELGIGVQIMPAIKPKDLEFLPLESLVDLGKFTTKLGHTPRPEQICCALSHYFVYKEMLTCSDDYFLVFEDDASIDSKRVSTLIQSDLLKTSFSLVVQLFSRGLRSVDLVLQKDSDQLVFFRHPPGQTAAYIISREVAFRAVRQKIDGPADWPSWSQNASFMGLFPWAATEGELPTSLGVMPVVRLYKQLMRRIRLVLSGGLSFHDFVGFVLSTIDFLFATRILSRLCNIVGPWPSLFPPPLQRGLLNDERKKIVTVLMRDLGFRKRNRFASLLTSKGREH